MNVPSGVLFYPCSGWDYQEPLSRFSELVDEFWFVDIRYSPDRINVPGGGRFRVDDWHVWRPTPLPRQPWEAGKQAKYPWIDPVVLTRRLYDRETGRSITVHWRSGYGAAALRRLENPIAVFFYRGDSPGEGGSGTLWLMGGRRAARPLIREVVEKMPSGGLVVTDGSNCPRRRNPYAALGRFHWSNVDGSEAAAMSEPFCDPDGRRFECVGFVGPRYGPTLVWRVTF